MATQTSDKKKYEQTFNELQTILMSEGWWSHWQDLQKVFLPRRGQFLTTDTGRAGKKRHNNIINNTPIKAANILASGLMSGATSPARPWFRLGIEDDDLSNFGPVKEWLEDIRNRMLDIFAKSNIYRVFHTVYRDLGVFGTGVMSLEQDADKVIRAFPYAIGSYYLALNSNLDVDTMYRVIPLRVGQIVEMFGIDNVSQDVKSMFERGNLFDRKDVIHLVEPNRIRDHNLLDNQNMPFTSAYYEKASKSDLILRKGGFEDFPIMAPRWQTNGVDTYGSSPGMDALGDNRSMQLKEKQKNTLLGKIVDPPMVAPGSLRGKYASLVSADITFIDPSDGNNQKFEPIQTVDPRGMGEIRQDIEVEQTRIDRAFFVDLFLMISQMEGIQPRNELEILSRKEEKLVELGPSLENIQNDLLDPAIDRTFRIMEDTGNLPPAPEELQGQELSVEYISIMAQAQKAIGTTGLQETFGFVERAAQLDPSALDKLDIDKSIEEFASMKGVSPKIIRVDEEVQAIRDSRQQAQQAQQKLDQAQQATEAAKNLAQSPTGDGSNALTDIAEGLQQ